jgi:hypothetical protein
MGVPGLAVGRGLLCAGRTQSTLMGMVVSFRCREPSRWGSWAKEKKALCCLKVPGFAGRGPGLSE